MDSRSARARGPARGAQWGLHTVGQDDVLPNLRHWVGFRFRLPEFTWPLTALPYTDKRRRLDKALVERHVERALERRLKKKRRSPEGSGVANGVAADWTPNGHHGAAEEQQQKKFVLGALAKDHQNQRLLRDELLQVFFAGRDTTAFLLSLHPAHFAHLCTTIFSAFPPDKNYTITPSALKAHRPLFNFLSETLRLYPVTLFNGRVALRDTVLPAGGGQIVAYCVYVLRRREDVWGEDAAVFRPERWEENRGRKGWGR
ncbi:hypothetical protein FGG08_000436 [Glutinoglossum americanum]|uniref:Uncharacterized protein n=1 Tax=Glutinoglossum americanum TaxID=1670608 RepID=A0A9P8ID38_9PEZI|nr:hypothetical protein FGG08_000436 [Glutinoglossum americanum]